MRHHDPIRSRTTAFATPWFQVIAKETDLDPKPYYSLALPDYVGVVAITTDGDMLFVRQYRPAIEATVLELPAGMVDPGESPQDTIARELIEETGHETETLEHLGTLYSDTGRLQNRLWCYFADRVRPVAGWQQEQGVEVVKMRPRDALDAVRRGDLNHALNLSVFML